MKIKFEETLNILKILNEFKNNNVYLQDEIEEENDNIDDINKIEKRFQMAIENLKNIDKNEEDKVIKILIDLHLIYSDFIWQYEQMHEMVKKMISQYRNN
ncbi:hypothetical protein [Clostridium sp. JS66]|uniref:hypothetical protein n=1 Tax=Clostridium sp. JS66 TaxID=3064705 RepID=UPI00298DB2B8|nr:hypothetical protein [Clostridium sp. JS66]WPC42743.1 hypothetical protein Q6H37_04525 [Clostridium sp. JS66]